jgi:hypothetical protein
MTQSEKLEKLVEYAIENGFELKDWDRLPEVPGAKQMFINTLGDAKTLIFNHDFAKALFGKEEICITCEQSRTHVAYRCDFPAYELTYRHFLQQAVIAPNPIDYMYKEVFGK